MAQYVKINSIYQPNEFFLNLGNDPHPQCMIDLSLHASHLRPPLHSA